jgi:hypothetical protein
LLFNFDGKNFRNIKARINASKLRQKRVENALILKLKRAKNVVNLSTGFDLENRVQNTLQHIFLGISSISSPQNLVSLVVCWSAEFF